MAHMIDSWGQILRRAGYEARENAPLALIVLAMISAVILGQIDFRLQQFEAVKYVLPGAVFLVASVVALFAHLQRVNRASKRDLLQARADVGMVVADGAQRKQPIQFAIGNEANLEKELKELLAEEQIKQFHLHQIRAMADGMINRLRDEIYRLGSRANLNLAVGAVVCLTGFAVLGYYVFSGEHSTETAKEVIQLAVRFSLVLFIEVFAYFFLNLYRGGLLDIKYFQNEITNATFRLMALEAAFVKSDTATVKRMCEDMSRTERNFVLKKGDTTYDLRQAELLMQHERSMVSTFERFVNLSSRVDGGSQTKQRDGRSRGSRGKAVGND